MNAEEFATIFKKEKDNLQHDYLKSQRTMANKLIGELHLDEKQMLIMERLINVLLTDVFYTILLGLDGASNIGGIQQIYKLYDENGNLISDCGDLEAAAYKVFHEEEV